MRTKGTSIFVILVIVAAAGAVGWYFGSTRSDTAVHPRMELAPVRAEVELYFSDDQAMYLVPERRFVTVEPGQSLPEAVLEELINGPRTKGLWRTIPESAKVLSVDVRNGIAYVNLSRAYQSDHWGGSTGDMMTTYSVVNTLTRLDGITAVQFLLEGQKEDAILGHMDTSRPLTFNEDLARE